MTARLASKVVVVTGGSSGIGRAVAQRVASEGAAVVIGARRANVGEQVAAGIRGAGGRALGAAMNPAGRVAQPEEIAAFVAFLLSDESTFVTGAALAIDGGLTAQSPAPAAGGAHGGAHAVPGCCPRQRPPGRPGSQEGTVEEPDWAAPLGQAYDSALAYLTGLPARPVGSSASRPALRAALGGPLPEAPEDPRKTIAALAEAAEPGLVATPSGRFFGFVVGGATPAALAADWLTAAWDQNAGLHVLGPAAAVVEEVAGGWLAELLGLPAGASVGFVTGVQMAHFTALAAARHELLRRAGWNVEADGLAGAPRVRVLAGQQRHDTVDRALRFLGFGTSAVTAVGVDDQGRMRPAALRAALGAGSGPTIVCAQAGNVNTGAVDPLGETCDLAHQAGAWVHVDGAFGMWAAASPTLRHLVAGVERADSWATDAHKWLNVPYDSGLVFCAHPDAHRAAMGVRASYLIHGGEGERDELDHNPEFSRRARGFAVYAAIRAQGRAGIAGQVDRCCALARRFAERLAAHDGVEVLNDVVLNQVLVRFQAADGDHDAHTRGVVGRVQQDGTCWMSGTTWHGQAAMRISVTNWSTDEADVDRSVAAILRCARPAAGHEPTRRAPNRGPGRTRRR